MPVGVDCRGHCRKCAEPVCKRRCVSVAGPAIGPQAFEVGDDVLAAFSAHDDNAHLAFKPGKQAGKWWADMNHLTRLRLAKLGIERVFDNGLCTYQDANLFYSYRRDGVTGRQASFIWIDEN